MVAKRQVERKRKRTRSSSSKRKQLKLHKLSARRKRKAQEGDIGLQEVITHFQKQLGVRERWRAGIKDEEGTGRLPITCINVIARERMNKRGRQD